MSCVTYTERFPLSATFADRALLKPWLSNVSGANSIATFRDSASSDRLILNAHRDRDSSFEVQYNHCRSSNTSESSWRQRPALRLSGESASSDKQLYAKPGFNDSSSSINAAAHADIRPLSASVRNGHHRRSFIIDGGQRQRKSRWPSSKSIYPLEPTSEDEDSGNERVSGLAQQPLHEGAREDDLDGYDEFSFWIPRVSINGTPYFYNTVTKSQASELSAKALIASLRSASSKEALSEGWPFCHPLRQALLETPWKMENVECGEFYTTSERYCEAVADEVVRTIKCNFVTIQTTLRRILESTNRAVAADEAHMLKEAMHWYLHAWLLLDKIKHYRHNVPESCSKVFDLEEKYADRIWELCELSNLDELPEEITNFRFDNFFAEVDETNPWLQRRSLFSGKVLGSVDFI